MRCRIIFFLATGAEIRTLVGFFKGCVHRKLTFLYRRPYLKRDLIRWQMSHNRVPAKRGGGTPRTL